MDGWEGGRGNTGGKKQKSEVNRQRKLTEMR